MHRAPIALRDGFAKPELSTGFRSHATSAWGACIEWIDVYTKFTPQRREAVGSGEMETARHPYNKSTGLTTPSPFKTFT